MRSAALRKHRQRVKDIIEALCNKLLDDQAVLKVLSQSRSASMTSLSLLKCLQTSYRAATVTSLWAVF